MFVLPFDHLFRHMMWPAVANLSGVQGGPCSVPGGLCVRDYFFIWWADLGQPLGGGEGGTLDDSPRALWSMDMIHG